MALLEKTGIPCNSGDGMPHCMFQGGGYMIKHWTPALFSSLSWQILIHSKKRKCSLKKYARRRLTVSTSVWCSVKSRGSVSESVNTGIFILPAFESWLGVFPEGEMSSMLKRRAPRQAGNRTALPLRLDGWQDRETLHSHSQGSDL
ncbi:hypothetical protein Naga_100050g4 [Nannochloropsis gaditana]|uniref:Uncharacterized protein n=1 Tax=Nannochloropsis gaditana TaxID=72520 RepID=W7UA47_9STRA|nr:hypothetical protein Naga_100050g4 [Nannochloropsis gaditana]